MSAGIFWGRILSVWGSFSQRFSASGWWQEKMEREEGGILTQRSAEWEEERWFDAVRPDERIATRRKP